MMEQSFSVPFPVSVNQIYQRAKHGVFLTPKAQAYKSKVGWTAKACGIEVMTGQLEVEIWLWEGRGKRRMDIDNPLKILLDSLNGVAWEDDSQIVNLHIYRRTSYEKSHAQITIRRA